MESKAIKIECVINEYGQKTYIVEFESCCVIMDAGCSLEEIKQLDSKYYMNTFGERTPLCFTKGEGITLTATDGKTYKAA